MILYKNNNYEVLHGNPEGDDDFNYHVCNTETGLIELKTDVLPQAIMASDEFNAFLESLTSRKAEVVDFPKH